MKNDHINVESAADLMDNVLGRTKREKNEREAENVETSRRSNVAGAEIAATTGPAQDESEIPDVKVPQAEATTPIKATTVQSPTQFPNPLGYELTACHLPAHFVKSPQAMLKYVGSNVSKTTELRIAPSKNEMALYEVYKKLCGRANARPLISRTFAAAARLISIGKPIDPATERTIDKFHL